MRVSLVLLLFTITLAATASAAVTCGPGQVWDGTITEACVPQFPAPLAFVGPLMDPRFTACDISFERMMCGGAVATTSTSAAGSSRALDYARVRHRKALKKALQQRNSPWWRSCVSGRPDRREASIEYKHVVERLLASTDLRVPADLPAAWGRLNRAGYAHAAGSPFSLHKDGTSGEWFLSSVPMSVVQLGEAQFVQALQAGPVQYGAVELQQRVGYVVEVAQVLRRHRTHGTPTSTVIRYSDLPQSWPWSLYFGGVTPPAPDDLILCDDLQYVEWALQNADRAPFTVQHWRAWLEFNVAQAHQGHVAASEEACLNLTLSHAPELANDALLAAYANTTPGAEVKKLGDWLLSGGGGGGTTVDVMAQRGCPLEVSMSPDRWDHNANLMRAWRWARAQTTTINPLTTAVALDWSMTQPPLFDASYGDVSKYAIFGTQLLGNANGGNRTAALEAVIAKVWPSLPLTGDKQHFFMVYTQAWCDGDTTDKVLRAIPQFSEVFGCYEGQAMFHAY